MTATTEQLVRYHAIYMQLNADVSIGKCEKTAAAKLHFIAIVHTCCQPFTCASSGLQHR